MNPLKISKSKHTPEVVLDKQNNMFMFVGKSLPEDPKNFYMPILEWIDMYVESPNKDTNVIFDMLYFNTSSSKFIYEIMKRLEAIKNKNCKINITWKCKEDDEDMVESGEIYASQVNIPFNFSLY